MNEEMRDKNEVAFNNKMKQACMLSKQPELNDYEKMMIGVYLGMCKMLASLEVAYTGDDFLLDRYKILMPDICKHAGLPQPL